MPEMSSTLEAMTMPNQPYIGPGLWVRITHRFRTRMTEWLLAGITAAWGLVLLLPGQAFDQPAFAGFRAIFWDENALGVVMVLFGLARVAGLIVNGARKNVTPHIRVVSAAFGCMVFVGMCYCFMLSGIVSTWLAIYPFFVIGELTNVYRAAHDVGESLNGKAR